MEFGSFAEFHIREGRDLAGSFREGFSHVDEAERLGLDALWLSESHFNPTRSVLSSPLSVASAIASRTERIKIGTAVSILPLGNPLRTAEEVATIDHVSNGRFEFGVGRSGLPGSYEGYNFPYAESRERFHEYLDIILTAWQNERFSYEGKFFSYDDVCLIPKPFQTPHPLIRVATTSTDTFEMMGNMGFPIFIGVRTLSLEQVAEQVGVYKRAWESSDHEGEVDISLRVPVYVAPTKEEALSESRESFMKQFRRIGGALALSVARAGADPRDLRRQRSEHLAAVDWEEDVIGNKAIVGTPEMVIDQIRVMKERLSLSALVCEFNAGELIPEDKISRSLRLMCDEVIPAFK